MRVVMLQDQVGSENGIHLALHVKGEAYDLVESLAVAYINEGWAELESAQPVVDVPIAPKKNTAQSGPKRRKGAGK